MTSRKAGAKQEQTGSKPGGPMKRWGKNEAPGSSDISKCDSDDCPAKMDCHRYLVRKNSDGDSIRQSYIIWQPGEPKGYDCHLYWPEYEEER